ncbi:SDR family oxidoreductase [Candidatus Poribacteria bacterium]|nr:SDR family oxidoreductase [Candidatus Poribacteria bacterium]
MPFQLTDDGVAAYRSSGAVFRTAEYARYPDLFRQLGAGGAGNVALVVGAAAKRLPDGVEPGDGDDERSHSDAYGFGVGRMAALALASRGWDVIGTYRGSEVEARQLELMLRSHFGSSRSRMLPLDVSDVASVVPFVRDLGVPIRAVIYSPSVQVRRERIGDVSADDYAYCFDGNCRAYAELVRGLLSAPSLPDPDAHGIRLRIAYVGSISGSGTPSPGRAAYCVSKAAGMELTGNISAAYAPSIMAFNMNVSIADTAATVNVRAKYEPIMARESHVGSMLSARDVANALVANLVDVHINHGANIDATAGWRRNAL